MPSTADETLDLVRLIASIGALIAAGEIIAGRRHLGPDRLLSWPVLRSARLWTQEGPLAAGLDFLFRPSLFLVLMGTSGAAALAGILRPHDRTVEAVSVPVIVAVWTLGQARLRSALAGSDSLRLLIFWVLALKLLGGGTPLATEACAWAIALHACIAYFVSGIYKAVSPVWRSGDAVVGICGTRFFGSPRASVFFKRNHWAPRVAAWATFVPELLFPAALLLGPAVCLAFLAWGAAFHLGVMLVMRLNGFVWAFVATYPAIYYVSLRVQELIR
jgi:hypothetical protein